MTGDWQLVGVSACFGVMLVSMAASAFDIRRLWPLNRKPASPEPRWHCEYTRGPDEEF